jgi:uncharacterized protein (DUF924 family)
MTTILNRYNLSILLLLIALGLGYHNMPLKASSPRLTAETLNRTLFNSSLYTTIQSHWFADVPTGSTTPTPDAVKRWFFNPNEAEKASFDNTCRTAFGPALEAISPRYLPLPLFKSWTTERELANSIAAPFLQEINPKIHNENQAASNALSLILLLDQMSRNIFRTNQAVIYSHFDRLSRALLHIILTTQPRLDLHPAYRHSPVFRTWFYMPLVHSESLNDHQLFETIITELRGEMAAKGDEEAVKSIDMNLDFEARHKTIIERFGRYPYRNEVLQRQSTEEEEEWLANGGERFGT